MTLPIHDPSQWPLRMTRAQVSQVHQRSVRWLHDRLQDGRYPQPDAFDGRWAREVVRHLATGGIKKFDEAYARTQRRTQRQPMRMVGAAR